jgi:hypothetical protein
VSSRRASATRATLGPRRWATCWAVKRPRSGSRTAVVAASTSIQRNQREPCLAGVAAAGVGVAGALPRGQPGPGAQPLRCGEPADLPDLGDHGGGRHQPDAGDRQQASGARVAGELGAQVGVGAADLDGDGVDQPPAGIQPTTRGDRQLQLGQPAAPDRAEQGGQLGDDAQVGQQGVRLGLQPRAHPDQAGAGTDQAAGLAGVGRGDPGLGQQVAAQQVRQGSGVDGVVLDPGGRGRLVASGWATWAAMPAPASRSANQLRP